MKNKIITTLIVVFSILSATTATGGGIVPKPVSQEPAEGFFMLGSGTAVESRSDVEFGIRRYLEGYLQRAFPDSWRYTAPKTFNIIRLVQSASAGLPAEGYRLTVEPETITVEAGDRAGLFYGIETLLQLMPAGIYDGRAIEEPCAIPCQTITDHPALGYRGMMLDVARTFSDKQTVLRLIDRMAHHKLNRFHWHLADDEGWRVELDCYPELAHRGGFRGGDSPVQPIYGKWDEKYGGYYTKDDIREVVAYAAFRNIEVIPEIDLPGHSRTAAKVFPSILCGTHSDAPTSKGDRRNVWCAAKENNYLMLEKIIAELAELFPSPTFHIGGDEVLLGQWKGCADCRRLMQKEGYTETIQLEDYFIKRVSAMVEKSGKTPAVWDEAMARGKLARESHVHGWQGLKQCLASTAKGYKTIVMPGAYFYIDMRQSPDEDGQTWATIIDAERLYSFGFAKTGFDGAAMKNVLGVEGAFWAEILTSHEPSWLDYQLYPRLCALAEVGWTDEKARDWNDFYRRLTSAHLDRLGAMGIGYRQFPPAVDYKKRVITAQAPFEGAEIRYTEDGTPPTPASPLYTTPITTSHPEDYRFGAFYGAAASPSIVPAAVSRRRIAAGATETFEIALDEIIDTVGLWYLRLRVSDSNMKIHKVAVGYGGKQQNIVGYVHNVNQLHRMRFYANESNRKGTLSVKVQNLNAFGSDIAFILERSPYIEPAVKFTSSLSENTRFPFKHVEDYNFSTYSRTASTCKKGDHFTFTFTAPVDAESITIASGLSYMPRYNVFSGRVQTSTDGIRFTDAAPLELGMATIHPDGPLKAVRIVSDLDGNGESAVALQDLRIKPRRK